MKGALQISSNLTKANILKRQNWVKEYASNFLGRISSDIWSDLNPIKNLRSILKMKLYEGDKQYNKADQWKAIKTTLSETETNNKITDKING